MVRRTKVNLDVKNVIYQGNDVDRFNLKVSGILVKSNDLWYLTYQDHETKTVWEIYNSDHLKLKRIGNNKTTYDFIIGKVTHTCYQTQYGVLNFDVITEKIDLFMDENWKKGKITLKYQLETGKMIVGKYIVQLKFNA